MWCVEHVYFEGKMYIMLWLWLHCAETSNTAQGETETQFTLPPQCGNRADSPHRHLCKSYRCRQGGQFHSDSDPPLQIDKTASVWMKTLTRFTLDFWLDSSFRSWIYFIFHCWQPLKEHIQILYLRLVGERAEPMLGKTNLQVNWDQASWQSCLGPGRDNLRWAPPRTQISPFPLLFLSSALPLLFLSSSLPLLFLSSPLLSSPLLSSPLLPSPDFSLCKRQVTGIDNNG